MAPQFTVSLAASWELMIGGMEWVLHELTHPPTLHPPPAGCCHQIVCCAKCLVLSQSLPLPDSEVGLLCLAVGDFLWQGCLEHLVHEELYIPLSKGRLRLSSILTRAQALMAKQACQFLVAGWVGVLPATWLIGSASTSRPLSPPFVLASMPRTFPLCTGTSLTSFLRSLATPDMVISKALYVEFTSTLPCPKI